MPELPEVEVLVRHLNPLLRQRTIRSVEVRRARVVRPTPIPELVRVLRGAAIGAVSRRGKYLLFEIIPRGLKTKRLVVGHLGMTGRMYLMPKPHPLPKHAAVIFSLGKERFVFEDTRYFGRLTLDTTAIDGLGPEPLDTGFSLENFKKALERSAQPIKVKLLDQSLIAGVGNIYASEALFRARISPCVPARRLNFGHIERLLKSIRETLSEAIALGSTLSLDYAGAGDRDKLFYYGSDSKQPPQPDERFFVYDREGLPCLRCGSPIRRIVQAARSTFYCPKCQGKR